MDILDSKLADDNLNFYESIILAFKDEIIGTMAIITYMTMSRNIISHCSCCVTIF